MMPVLTIEIGGEFLPLPVWGRSKVKNIIPDRVFVGDWFRVAWLFFAIGIVTERARYFTLVEEGDEDA